MSNQNEQTVELKNETQAANKTKKEAGVNWVSLFQTISLWITGILIAGISVFFVYWTLDNLYLNTGTDIKWDLTGQVGDFFGGVVGTLVAAFGSILIYMTFRSQSQAQQNQHEQFETTLTAQKKTDADQRREFMKAQIENRFIMLIQLHKENLKSFSFKSEGQTYYGREGISKIVVDIETCYKEIKPFFVAESIENIYAPDYQGNCERIFSFRNSLDLITMAQLEIAYCFVFFGTEIVGIEHIKPQLEKHYNVNFVRTILFYLYLKPADSAALKIWHDVNNKVSAKELSKIVEDEIFNTDPPRVNIEEEPQEENIRTLLNGMHLDARFYNGHQDVSSQYFRHLFQSVKYINKQNILNYEEKYEYIKTLRAQLSNIEQYLLFYNSISLMGREWEFKHIPVDSPNPDWDLWLFTKYNFIKNIPLIKMMDTNIDISTYYPDIHFEFEDEPINRRFLIEKFN